MRSATSSAWDQIPALWKWLSRHSRHGIAIDHSSWRAQASQSNAPALCRPERNGRNGHPHKMCCHPIVGRFGKIGRKWEIYRSLGRHGSPVPRTKVAQSASAHQAPGVQPGRRPPQLQRVSCCYRITYRMASGSASSLFGECRNAWAACYYSRTSPDTLTSSFRQTLPRS